MISSLLIANRGEIACRVIRTARRLGVRTVAVYSDADAKALHVRQADEAVHIGPSPARESYLVGEKIIAAARQTGAEAIHPGYGFLSENADFAQAVIDAGLVWVGPKPHAIRAMGLKDAAKKLMMEAGVPVTPGYLGEDQNPERLRAEADAIGYPLLIKAVAGGGGKGMRLVEARDAFADALAAAKREAASSFGNDAVLLERYIQRPRHIEVQVFGDAHGNVVHLFERDCSLQRRHQKVIEEAPAPGMDEATREAVCAAAVRAAKAVDYESAGTIEFIADASEGLRADRIWFMEMNTRLQVEHPVTEEITGQDLVEWQLRVASGEPLPKRQDELSINGHAIEARLYAEDPSKGFLPSVGRVDYLGLPDGIRVDTGVEEYDEVSPYYDPMIAKLIVLESDRAQATDRLARACREVAIEPVRTNAWFLSRLLHVDAFRAGDVTTGLIAGEGERLTAAPEPSDGLLKEAAQWFAFDDDLVKGRAGDPDYDRMRGLFGFRLNTPRNETVRLTVDGQPREVLLTADDIWSRDSPSTGGSRLGRVITLMEGGAAFSFELNYATGTAGAAAGDGALTAPMPGRVTGVAVRAGEAVVKGQALVTLEAMKMEHALTAPFDGTVAELPVEAGAQVSEGTLLVRVEPRPEDQA